MKPNLKTRFENQIYGERDKGPDLWHGYGERWGTRSESTEEPPSWTTVEEEKFMKSNLKTKFSVVIHRHQSGVCRRPWSSIFTIILCFRREGARAKWSDKKFQRSSSLGLGVEPSFIKFDGTQFSEKPLQVYQKHQILNSTSTSHPPIPYCQTYHMCCAAHSFHCSASVKWLWWCILKHDFNISHFIQWNWWSYLCSYEQVRFLDETCHGLNGHARIQRVDGHLLACLTCKNCIRDVIWKNCFKLQLMIDHREWKQSQLKQDEHEHPTKFPDGRTRCLHFVQQTTMLNMQG